MPTSLCSAPCRTSVSLHVVSWCVQDRSHQSHVVSVSCATPCFRTQVAATSDEKLNQPLLQFHEDSTAELQLLAVNFDPALVKLLKETKYFLILNVQVC